VTTKDDVLRDLSEAAFGRPLISNMYRGLVAEVLVKSCLGSDWDWCSADWAGWDFAHSDGCKLEVKQTADVQTWENRKSSIPRTIFGIPSSAGFYEGARWVEKAGRQADIYVFAHHPIGDRQVADHRDPEQWVFYVVPARVLPVSQTISISTLRALTIRVWQSMGADRSFPCTLDELAAAIEEARVHLSSTQSEGNSVVSASPTLLPSAER
jgi:hypothetical protein